MRVSGRLGLTLTWYAGIAAWLRYWDLTQRVPPLLLWTLLGTGLYVATIRVTGGRLRAQASALTRAGLWLGLVVVVGAVILMVPGVTIRGVPVNTGVFAGLLDGVLPVWIAMSAIASCWTGAWR